jgi:hypothetical protein
LTACGSSGAAATAQKNSALLPGALHERTSVTLVLDFIPNAVHAGIYRAIAAGYYAMENIDLHVVQPTSTSETLKLIDAGRAQFGLADGIDVADEIATGHDAKAIMAITQLPLGAPIALASEHLTSPAQLQGKTVGITGVPSDTPSWIPSSAAPAATRPRSMSSTSALTAPRPLSPGESRRSSVTGRPTGSSWRSTGTRSHPSSSIATAGLPIRAWSRSPTVP